MCMSVRLCLASRWPVYLTSLFRVLFRFLLAASPGTRLFRHARWRREKEKMASQVAWAGTSGNSSITWMYGDSLLSPSLSSRYVHMAMAEGGRERNAKARQDKLRVRGGGKVIDGEVASSRSLCPSSSPHSAHCVLLKIATFHPIFPWTRAVSMAIFLSFRVVSTHLSRSHDRSLINLSN